MSKPFNSIYAESLQAYIQMKQQFGFAYKTGALILAQLDRLAAKRGESTPGISPALAEAWVARRPHESEHSRYQRVGLLIGFSSYLVDLGTDSFIPKPPAYPSPTFIPYIYSSQQMQALFQACDQLRLYLLDTDSSLLSMPTLIRLLYATGIRIGEALNLKNQDINLEEHYLQVKDSKNGKERLIPISASLVSVCQQYLDYRNHLPLEKKPIYFFVKLNGGKCSDPSVRHWFEECRGQAGIPYMARIHDLFTPLL
jgi:integrase